MRKYTDKGTRRKPKRVTIKVTFLDGQQGAQELYDSIHIAAARRRVKAASLIKAVMEQVLTQWGELIPPEVEIEKQEIEAAAKAEAERIAALGRGKAVIGPPENT